MTTKTRRNFAEHSSDRGVRERLRELIEEPMRDLPDPNKCGEAERQWRGRHAPRTGIRR